MAIKPNVQTNFPGGLDVFDAGQYDPAMALAVNAVESYVLAGVDPVNAVAVSGATQALLAGTMNRYVLSTNCTFALPAAVKGSSFTAAFVQPASGGPYTPTITSADYGAAGTPTWSTVANKKDIVVGYCDDGSTWQVVLSGTGF